MRERLPTKRSVTQHSLTIGNHKVVLGLGRYADGRIGEIWIDAFKDGTAIRALTTALARVCSIAIQNGVPTATISQAMAGITGEPDGMVIGHDTVKEATSVPDLVAQILEAEVRQAK